jgi:hypothetical protein
MKEVTMGTNKTMPSAEKHLRDIHEGLGDLFKDHLCVEVTIKRLYIIDHGINGWTDEQIIDEWFP